MNNKIVSTKTTSAFFLAIVLVTGTFAVISPSSFIIGVNAQIEPYDYGIDNRYNSYEPDYGMDKDRKPYGTYGYEPQDTSYGKDDKRDKSSKDSKSVSINKLKCINTNLNINGNNTGNISIGNKGQGYLGASSSGSGGYDGYSKQDKGFECIINNNNNNTAVGQTIPPPIPPSTPPPPEGNANLIVIKRVINDNGGTGTASDFTMSPRTFDIFEGGCNIELNPTNYPPFPGSESGTTVQLLVDEEGSCYGVDESFNVPEIGEYDTTSVGCLDIIRPGETRICTWTNDDR